MYNLKVFPERLKEACQRVNMKQKTLASTIGVSAQTISQYSNGNMLPTLENATAIAESLGVSLDWLLGGEDRFTDDTVADLFRAAELLNYGLTPTIDKLYCDPNIKHLVILHCDPGRVSNPFFKAMKELDTMGKLLKDGTIDEEIFNAWRSKKLEDLDKILIDEVLFKTETTAEEE